MNRLLLAALLILSLGGCPTVVPDAGRFAGDALVPGVDGNSAGADAQADVPGTTADNGAGTPGNADTSSGKDAELAADAAGDAVPGDAVPGDALPGDVVPGDVATADSSGAKGPCASGIGLYAKAFDQGGSEAAYALVATTDGGALLVGDSGSYSKSDVLLLRVGAFGTTIWSKTYGGSGEDHGKGVIAATDGFAIAGITRSSGAGLGDGWLLRTDAKGNLLWDKTYGGTGNDEFHGIAPAGDGFLLAGMNRSLGGGSEDGWLVRTDAAGAVLWQKKYGGSGYDEFNAVVALPGGGFAAAGKNASTASNGSDAWLTLVDGSGNQVASKLFGLGETDDARALTRLPDGGFALTGTASSGGNPDLWVLRTDSGGNLTWKDVVTGNQQEIGQGIAAFADGSLAVVGVTDSTGSNGGEDAWLLRYDPWGNRMWNQHYGDNGNQWGEAVAVLEDGGMLFAGRRFGQSTSMDAWFLRTDPWGHADCAAAGACKFKAQDACDDQNACTVDQCDGNDGCTHTALPLGASCGVGAACGAAGCVGG